MGVDCVIRLPENVRSETVADVIGILSGKPATKSHFSQGDGWHTAVQGVKVESASVPGLLDINIDGPLSKDVTSYRFNQGGAWALYHLEPTGGGRLLMPRSTAYWIAVGRGLVKFFGGSLDYNDCDDKSRDYSVRHKTTKENAPSNGRSWYDLQERLLALKPLTRKDFEFAEKYAAYKVVEL